MLALIEKKPPITQPKINSDKTCIIHDDTVICGKIIEVDYF